jgi:hypothetical protein
MNESVSLSYCTLQRQKLGSTTQHTWKDMKIDVGMLHSHFLEKIGKTTRVHVFIQNWQHLEQIQFRPHPTHGSRRNRKGKFVIIGYE